MNLIRVAGTPEYVEFEGGLRIYNPHKNKLFVPGETFSRYVAVVDYDNHFIGLNPRFEKMAGSNFAYCSCGAPAVIVGYNAYKTGASASSGGDGMIPGEMIVCMTHAETGHHNDGST